MSVLTPNRDKRRDELGRLVSAHCSGTLTSDDRDRLIALLTNHPENQLFCVKYFDMHARLAWRYRERAEAPSSLAIEVCRNRFAKIHSADAVLAFLGRVARRLPIAHARIVGSLLAFVVIAAFWGLYSHWSRIHDRQAGVGDEFAVARISNPGDAIWHTDADADSGSSRIRTGKSLRINSGLVELRLKQGVTLIVEGPAEWTIDGENSATLTHGKLVAKVPQQAIGFTLETPTAKIVDLGTEFGVEISENGESRVQVLRGRVRLSAGEGAAAGSTSLKAGEAVRVSSDRRVSSIPFESKAFADLRTRASTSGDVSLTARLPADASFTNLSELRLWLRADRGVETDGSGRVAVWRDQSPNGFDAAQVEPSRRPTPADKSAATRAVRFDGIDDFLTCESGVGCDGRQDSTLFLLLEDIGVLAPDGGVFALRSRQGGDTGAMDAFCVNQDVDRTGGGIDVLQGPVATGVRGYDSLRLRGAVPPNRSAMVVVTRLNGTATLRINGSTTEMDRFHFPNELDSAVSEAGYLIGGRERVDGETRTTRFHSSIGVAEVALFDRAFNGHDGAETEKAILRRHGISNPTDRPGKQATGS